MELVDRKVTVSKKLKIARISLGIKIRDVADECNISQNVVYRLEASGLENNAFVRYLKYLHGKGIDLNKFFDDGK
jgi:transcriptional regulator with XRE-family HTH domain